ncbi:MAG TPA: hypothetical protein VEL06_17905 [Haliangiales bacterium]|nr:hypothetical protein [Haliangiales bacterium]
MPIRINLLAEQQAADDLRRRDPVKRALWVAGFIVGALAIWSGRLQVKLMAAKREVSGFEADWKKLEPSFQKVTANLESAADAQRKWAALQSLAVNRFLWANPLDALQYVIVKVDDIQVLRLKTDQTYFITEGVKPSTNEGVVSRGRPGTSRERVMLTLEAKDYSRPHPGDQIFKLQEAINSNPYFKTNLQKAELTAKSPEMADPATGRRYVTFTLDCLYSEKTR